MKNLSYEPVQLNSQLDSNTDNKIDLPSNPEQQLAAASLVLVVEGVAVVAIIGVGYILIKSNDDRQEVIAKIEQDVRGWDFEQVKDLVENVLFARKHQQEENPAPDRRNRDQEIQPSPGRPPTKPPQTPEVLIEAVKQTIRAEILRELGKKIKNYTEESIQQQINKLLNQAQPTLPKGKPGDLDHNLSGKPEAETGQAKENIQKQNESARILARAGYRVEQLEPVYKDGKKNPDYKIEGKIFDHYVVKEGKTPENIFKRVEKKIDSGQTQRVVLNLDNLDQKNLPTLQELANKLNTIKKLEEVIVINRGQIIGQIVFQSKEKPLVIDLQQGNGLSRQSVAPQVQTPVIAQQQGSLPLTNPQLQPINSTYDQQFDSQRAERFRNLITQQLESAVTANRFAHSTDRNLRAEHQFVPNREGIQPLATDPATFIHRIRAVSVQFGSLTAAFEQLSKPISETDAAATDLDSESATFARVFGERQANITAALRAAEQSDFPQLER